MWSREQLKNTARKALERNYWKVVLVSAILLFFGGASIGSFFSTGFTEGLGWGEDSYYESEADIPMDDLFIDEEGPVGTLVGMVALASVGAAILGIIFVVLIIILIIIIIATIVSFVIRAFLLNPLEVGTKKFFFINLKEKAEVKEVTFAYDNHYKNIIKILFFRDLYIFLWSLLFVIPGIIKAYEYKMLPYLLAEDPTMTKDQAFATSRQMMDGQKWKVFVLDLSFIGWELLSAITAGILGVFYVTPYRNMTYAALYECLSYERQWNSPEGAPVYTPIPPTQMEEYNIEEIDNSTEEV